MAPKTKITKEEIVKKAFELTRAQGFEGVTARLLAKELNCSTQPIFYVFRNMEDLKREVFLLTRRFFEENMLQVSGDEETPFFLKVGLKYIELAEKEKHLFRLLSMSGSADGLNSFKELAKNMPIAINPDVFVKTWIFTHGIATILSTNQTNIPKEEVKQMLLEACTSFSQSSISQTDFN